ncbi:enoyl-CoA hydratase/isomerase family protein [Peredibacter sp. HCB2-198]|uniref:enoyl-CoA hydratase/isomerase family protein n=1 Tax=Peredibacter sp. HCB2-198 TaxID=3383025 RepID=UPI0038B43479
MQTLFNYTTISTRLEKTTRTLFVTLNRPDWNNAFRLEMLFELESLLAWCTTRVEINSIFIDSSSPFFSSGYEYETLPKTSASNLDKINTKLQKIIFAMMQLPQTVVIDLGDGAETLASEFALGADIRIASRDAKISFNHCHYGLVPAAGGMSMLSTLISPSFARNWVLSGAPIKTRALTESGFLCETYESSTRSDVIRDILTDISKVAPVQRIQAKLGLFETLRSQFETGIVMDRKIAKASMVSEDWKTKKPETKEFDFMPAKSMSYAVKLSLIKNDEGPKNLEH